MNLKIKKTENIFYVINIKKNREEFKGARLQLPAGLNNLRFGYIINKVENVVKVKKEQSSCLTAPFFRVKYNYD